MATELWPAGHLHSFPPLSQLMYLQPEDKRVKCEDCGLTFDFGTESGRILSTVRCVPIPTQKPEPRLRFNTDQRLRKELV